MEGVCEIVLIELNPIRYVLVGSNLNLPSVLWKKLARVKECVIV